MKALYITMISAGLVIFALVTIGVFAIAFGWLIVANTDAFGLGLTLLLLPSCGLILIGSLLAMGDDS